MQAFVVIHLCDKMPDAGSRFVDVVIVVALEVESDKLVKRG